MVTAAAATNGRLNLAPLLPLLQGCSPGVCPGVCPGLRCVSRCVFGCVQVLCSLYTLLSVDSRSQIVDNRRCVCLSNVLAVVVLTDSDRRLQSELHLIVPVLFDRRTLTCDDVDVGVEVLAQAHGRAVPLKPVPELLLHSRRATQPVQPHHLTHTHTQT